MDPLSSLRGQNALLAEAGAIPFECIKGLIVMEIETTQELESVGSPSQWGDFWRQQVLLFFYALHGLSLVDMVESILYEEASEPGEPSETLIQSCSAWAQGALDQKTYLDFLPWIPKSPQDNDVERWNDLIEDYLMDVGEALPLANRLFRDRDWLISLPSSYPELPDAAVPPRSHALRGNAVCGAPAPRPRRRWSVWVGVSTQSVGTSREVPR